MLKKIACGMLYLLWDRKIYFRRKISDFGEVFSYLQVFFNFNEIVNHALVIGHSQGILVHFTI